MGARARGTVALLVLTTGCVAHPVGPARTFDTYQDKAATTAEAALSAVATTILAAQTGAAGDAWGRYLGVLVSDQEEEISRVQGTFSSIQPPDARSDALRRQLLDIVQPAADHIADVRIAIQRGQLDGLGDEAVPLEGDRLQLRAFLDVNQ